MRTKSSSLVATLSILASLALAGSATASNATLRVAVQHANKKIDQTTTLKADLEGLSGASKARLHSTGKLVAKEISNLEKAKSSVKAQKGSSQGAKEGRAEWLVGLYKLTKGYGAYEEAVKEYESGSSSVAGKRAKRGKQLLKAGIAEMRHAELLMKVRNPG